MKLALAVLYSIGFIGRGLRHSRNFVNLGSIGKPVALRTHINKDLA
jgi:hypothetical protein